MAEGAPGASAPPAGAATRDIVLLVDDTPDTLAMLTDALEQAGYTALVATGGAAALSVCTRVTPDVILLDAMMPGIDGFETCRRLKGDSAVAHVPVIFMTALSETEHIVEGFAAGGVDYVTKPIVLDELFARLKAHLANARAAQGARLALDSAGRYLLAVDRAGALRWASPQASRLLATAFPGAAEGAVLPPAALAPVLAALAGSGSQTFALPRPADTLPLLELSAVGPVGAGEFLFQIAARQARSNEDVLRQKHGLTVREAEVLLWIARGKSNRDIAQILSLSPRTVNKHLEGIYTKLGVENRASAAVIATRILDGG